MATIYTDNEKAHYSTSPPPPEAQTDKAPSSPQVYEAHPSPTEQTYFSAQHQHGQPQPPYQQGQQSPYLQQQQLFQQGALFQPIVQAQFVPQPTPLISLGQCAARVQCPRCGDICPTAATGRTGNSNHAWAAVVCFLTGLGCIPYLMNSLRDVEHRCSSCGAHLATWHRSGRTAVHAF